MHPRIDSSTAYGPMSAGTGANQQAATGSMRGDPCVAKDPASMLVDAAEELGREVSTKVAEKSSSERQVKASRHAVPLSVEKCREYLEKAQALDDKERLQKFADQLLKTGGQRAHEQAGRQAPGNPAEQYTLLAFARQQAADSHWPEPTIARIDAALENLWDTSGQQIATCLQTIDAAASYGETAPEVRAFQASFDLLATRPHGVTETLNLVMRDLAGKSGAKMELAFESLLSATGMQLAACRSEPEMIRLTATNDTLNDLKVMNTVKACCSELLSRTLEREAGAA